MNSLSWHSTHFRVVTAAAVLLVACTVLGQQAPALEKGFSAEKLYQFGDLDSINTFNGNLTFRIPIGPSYSVNAGMSYALTLTYNSKVWDYEEVAGVYTLAVPTRRSNAGLGWLLSLGRIITPANSVNTALADVYESPDSADHVFFGPLHDTDPAIAVTPPVTAVGYTRDTTYIRRLYKNDGTTALEFPDGTIKTFDSTSGDLKSVRDRFGNGFDVTTLTSVAGTPCSSFNFASAWKITDTSSARTNYVCFANTYQYPDATYPGLIERVVLVSPPDAHGSSQQAIYQFAYTTTTVCRGPGSTYPNAQRNIDLPRLTAVSQPDGSVFLFRYPPFYPGDTCGPGELTNVDLPTGGTISYAYGGYQIPVDKCNASPAWNSFVTGIATRTISGPRIPTAQWSYNSTISTPAALVACENNQGINVFRRAPAEQMIVSVTDPDANVEEHYYSVWPVPAIELIYDLSGQIIVDASGNPIQHSPNGFQLAEYGLPFTHLISSDGRLLSRRIYTPSGYAASPTAPLRSVYQSWEYDSVTCTAQDYICANSNARVNHDRTVYHDDGSTIADVDSSDFDGLGHYRTTALAGGFAAGNATIVTSFNKRDPDVNPSSGIDSGQYPGAFSPPTLGSAWLLDIPGSIKRTEAGVTATTQTCFSDATGFVRARRVLKDSARSATDLLSVYAPEQPSSPTGNVASESFFGGDVKQNAPTGTDLCALADAPPTDFEYKITHTYTDGVRTTSQYAGTTFLALDRTIDPPTGFVTSSRDTAGQETQYAYDAAFRLLSITPPGRVAAALTYSGASGSGTGFTPARVEMRSASQTSNTTSGAATSGTVEKHYFYDAMGRLWREKTRMPDDTWSVRDVLFDAIGRKASVSEQEQLTGSLELDFVPSHTTIFSAYDPFGRPGSVTLPSPDGHTTSFSYLGVRSMVRTSKIATAAGSESDAPVTETYDRQGRLYQLTENSAPDGSAVVTTYGHHVTDGLSSVSMYSNGTPQNRTFAYDGRGLLLYEEHPEKDGRVIYGASTTQPSYDSRGHATRMIDGPVDLTYAYDAAERLLSVSEIDPTSQTTPPSRRTLKSFTYGQSNDSQKGKLLTATRMNHLTDGRAVTATETYTYDSSAAIAKRDTAVTIDGIPFQTFSESFAYDDLGELAGLTYPTCLMTCGSASGAVGISERHYTNGALTSITGYATIGYNANATVGSVAHGNGVSDTITPDDSAMARPKSIAYSGFSGCPAPLLPVITLAPTSLCAGQSGGASVTGQQGATFTWTIEGGNITSSNIGLNITYTAISTTSVLLHVSASNNCGSSAVATASVSVTGGTAIQQQPQGTTIASGSTATLHVTATGTALTYQWYRGLSGDQSNSVAGATAADFTTPSLTATTTYWVKVVGQCGTANSASATVTINLPAPTNLRATTQQATPQGGANTVVTLRWNSVPGASAYLVEWSASVNGPFTAINPSNPTTVLLTATHVVSATTIPVAYVYHVRSVDSGGTASLNLSNIDYAVTGARLFASVNAQDEPIRKGFTPVRAMDIVELRRCIDALRSAAGVPQVWTGASPPSGIVTANDLLSLQSPLNVAMQAFGYGAFAYAGVPPPASCVTSPCVRILSEHVQQLRDTLRNALR